MLEKKALLENLRELKSCFLKTVCFFLVCVIFNFFIAEKFIDYFVEPLLSVIKKSNAEIVYTNIVEPFSIRMHLAIIGGILFSLPFTIWQIYSFICPGLYENEKKVIVPYLFISPILFITGALFVYHFIFPNAWDFFLKFAFIENSNSNIKMMIMISDYLNLCITMMILFGLSFQLPLILNLLLQLRVLSVKSLESSRKIVIVVIFIISAILTPPDVLSQVLLAIPLVFLYESSIILRKYLDKKKQSII